MWSRVYLKRGDHSYSFFHSFWAKVAENTKLQRPRKQFIKIIIIAWKKIPRFSLMKTIQKRKIKRLSLMKDPFIYYITSNSASWFRLRILDAPVKNHTANIKCQQKEIQLKRKHWKGAATPDFAWKKRNTMTEQLSTKKLTVNIWTNSSTLRIRYMFFLPIMIQIDTELV